MKRITRGRVLSGSGGGAVIAQGTFTHAAGTIAGAGGTVYTASVTGVAAGDFVTIAPNYFQGTAHVQAVVSAADTISLNIINALGTAIWGAGTVAYRVERPTS